MLVKRDPFARTELHKEFKLGKATGCDWCGRKSPKLFQFSTETDGGRKYIHDGQFCSNECHDSYHR